MKFKLNLLLLLTVALTIVGCSGTPQRTYSGEPLSPEKVSRITDGTRDFFLVTVHASITRVDGIEINNVAVVETLPGEHAVEVRLLLYTPFRFKRGNPQTISLTTEAGHTYQAYGMWNGGDNKIWIEDQKTKEVIAGRKPE